MGGASLMGSGPLGLQQPLQTCPHSVAGFARATSPPRRGGEEKRLRRFGWRSTSVAAGGSGPLRHGVPRPRKAGERWLAQQDGEGEPGGGAAEGEALAGPSPGLRAFVASIDTSVSIDRPLADRCSTPHPSRRCAPSPLLPQGEKGRRGLVGGVSGGRAGGGRAPCFRHAAGASAPSVRGRSGRLRARRGRRRTVRGCGCNC